MEIPGFETAVSRARACVGDLYSVEILSRRALAQAVARSAFEAFGHGAKVRFACMMRPVSKDHIAIYLGHVGLGLSQRQAQAGFGRDRTTVRYCCARVEDAREDAVLDRALDHLEPALQFFVREILSSETLSADEGVMP